MVRFITQKLTSTCAATLVASALVLTMAAPAAAEWPAGYVPGRDDNFMRVAEPPLYLAGFVLDWVIYRPVHAIMAVTKGETHTFAGYAFGSTEEKVRYVLNHAEAGDSGPLFASRR